MSKLDEVTAWAKNQDWSKNNPKSHIPKPRTNQQNASLWLFFQHLSDQLNEQGLEVKEMITMDIWWTKERVHDLLWIPFQKAKYGTTSTKDLNKIGQIDEIHTDLMRNLGEKKGVEWIDFPHDPEWTKLKVEKGNQWKT